MEIDQAKFILSSFRPDGRDAQDPDFAEALAMAAENRELGAWLAHERAQDAAFSSALSSIEMPEALREEILASLHQDVVGMDDPELDSAFFEAFSGVKPPEDLRDQILVAMEQEQKVVKGTFSIWKILPVAAAAVLAVSAFFIFGSDSGDSPGASQFAGASADTTVGTYDVQIEVGQQIRKDGIQLVSNSMEDSLKWLEAQKLPVADIPKTLTDMKCLGASEFKMSSGTKGSIVRFENSEGKQINMLVIANKDVKDQKTLPHCKISSAKDVKFCPMCKYWVARMKHKESVVILLSQLDKQATAGIF